MYNLLALYAALDKAVTASSNPHVAPIVEGYLPGSTGEGQRGWSGNLEDFLQRQFPPVDDALLALTDAAPLSVPQVSRLVYILGALMHVPGLVGIGPDQYVQGLGLAVPQTETIPGYVRQQPDPARQLFDVLLAHFHAGRDWNKAIAYALELGCLDPMVARVPLCNACLTTQDGVECVVVDTTFDDDSLTVGQVEAILDPRNWDKTAGEFFCSMDGLTSPPDPAPAIPYENWGHVLETVGAWCGSGMPELRTDLRFFKAQYSDGAVVQYDLSGANPNGGDGQVTVDKGWLKVVTGTAANPSAGVTVTTRKVVHIKTLWPIAQKIFVCVMGYGQAAAEMLLGHAKNPPPNLVAWADPPAPLTNNQAMQSFFSAPQGGAEAVLPPPAARKEEAAKPAAATAGASGGAVPKTAAGLAVSMMSEYLAETANQSAALAAKFADKDLTVDDLVTFSAKFGARMASEPWRFLARLAQLPATAPGAGPVQGGGDT
ncbi:hypothetical protein AWC20_07985 [Mycobacterium parmense]|nr:hypothetical protein AWC20_07985 [Mycobacterium parmense]